MRNPSIYGEVSSKPEYEILATVNGGIQDQLNYKLGNGDVYSGSRALLTPGVTLKLVLYTSEVVRGLGG